MKMLKVNGGGYSDYSAPSVTALEVVAEKGFAASELNGGLYENIPGSWGDGLNQYE